MGLEPDNQLPPYNYADKNVKLPDHPAAKAGPESNSSKATITEKRAREFEVVQNPDPSLPAGWRMGSCLTAKHGSGTRSGDRSPLIHERPRAKPSWRTRQISPNLCLRDGRLGRRRTVESTTPIIIRNGPHGLGHQRPTLKLG